MKTFKLDNWLPTTKKEVEARGWDYLDVILFSGDAYVDHPSFGAAVIGRVLEAEGLRVAIVPQPDWRGDYRDFKKLGVPRLFFGVSAGAMDSMINHYTANKRLRSDDAYTPDQRPGMRPDYPSIVYTKILKELYPDVPVVLGSIEASLRRLTHYDYWQDKLLPGILASSPADLLIYGMELMKQAVSPLADMPEFSSLLTAFNNPLLGVLVGAVFTGVIQSSAASVGILQALALTGSITYGIAIPVIMGQNIGTCVTALISSIGVNRNARRVAVIHISFNIIGSAVCLLLFYGGDILFHFQFLNYTVGALGIAACHTIFNVFTTLMLLPFSRQLEKLARAVIRGENKAEEFAFLDPLLLHTPSVAISECVAMSNRMGEVARENVHLALCQLSDYSNARESEILANEDKLDIYEDRLGSYLVQISQHGVSMNDIRTVSRLLHAIGDFERIGDHALNLQESAQELHEKELHFSEPANEELQVLLAAMDEIMEKAFGSFQQDSAAMAVEVEPLEETIDRLIEEIRMQHIRRLQTGACTIQLGFVFNDLLTNLERVSDHCSNIAVSIIEEQGDQVDRHTYINELKEESAFNMRLKDNLQKYQLPKG